MRDFFAGSGGLLDNAHSKDEGCEKGIDLPGADPPSQYYHKGIER